MIPWLMAPREAALCLHCCTAAQLHMCAAARCQSAATSHHGLLAAARLAGGQAAADMWAALPAGSDQLLPSGRAAAAEPCEVTVHKHMGLMTSDMVGNGHAAGPVLLAR